MQFYHRSLTGRAYLEQLKLDLENSIQLNFLVAYVSGSGIDAIGASLLRNALKKNGSYGITSLACGFDYNDIIRLQETLGSQIKLKIFLNLAEKNPDEESISLLHSKLIYLKIKANNEIGFKELVYLGSHNWTGRALGVGHGRNAEASVRIEYEPNADDPVLTQAKQHLQESWTLSPCFAATKENLPVFNDWSQIFCNIRKNTFSEDDKGEKMEKVLVMTAICASDYFTPKTILNLRKNPMYFPVFNEYESKFIRSIDQKIVILIWRSTQDLLGHKLPILLNARASTINETETGKGSNTSTNAVSGFEWVMFDEPTSNVVNIDGLGKCEYWTLKYLDRLTRSSEFDKKKPPVQFMLEVENIIPPEELESLGISDITGLFWKHGEISLSSRKNIRTEKQLGVAIEDDGLRTAIIDEYREKFEISRPAIKLVKKHDKSSFGSKLINDPINKLLIDVKKATNVSIYETNRLNNIITSPDIFSLTNQSVFNENTIHRIGYYHLEGASKLMDRVKKWRNIK